MSITKARNNFFKIVRRGYLKKEVVLVEKGEIPVSYIVPVDLDGVDKLFKERGVKKK
jgi:prevent-host-death family protein